MRAAAIVKTAKAPLKLTAKVVTESEELLIRAKKPGRIGPDRPDFTEDTSPVPMGFLQLEMGYTYSSGGGDRQHTLGELMLRAPLNDRLELRLTTPSFIESRSGGVTSAGFDSPTVGFKWNVSEGSEHPSLFEPALAFQATVAIPSGSPAVRSAQWLSEVGFALSWDLSEAWSVGGGLFVASEVEDGRSVTQANWSLGVSRTLGSRMQGYLELYGAGLRTAGMANQNFINGGLTYWVHDDLALDVHIGQGLNSIRGEYTAGVGMSVRF